MSIRNALLALLSDEPRYGFQLKKEFEEYTAGFWPLNVGQVYTTLGRLVRDGLVVEVEDNASEEQRCFELTKAGTAELEAWFATPRSSDNFERDELTIKIALAVAKNHPGIRDLIQTQRVEATTVLQMLTRRKATADPDDLYGTLITDAAISRVDSELRFLDLAEARIAKHSTGPQERGSR